MPTLRFDYPGLSAEAGSPIYEFVRAELRAETEFLHHYGPGQAVAELKAHAIFIPLAPGDLLLYDVDTGTALQLVKQAPVWTLDVDFKVPANLVVGQALPDDDVAVVTIKAATDEWQREAWVTQHSGLSFYVSAPDREWLEHRVMTNKYVGHVDMIRYPDMNIDLGIAIANADFGDLTIGPWS